MPLSKDEFDDYINLLKMDGASRFKKRRAIDKIEIHTQELEDSKNGAYKERDLLVAVLSKIFPAYIATHPEEEEWEDDWRHIIFIDIPVGKGKTAQVSWHIHDSEIGYFKHLNKGNNDWDGHTTKEKYNRLKRIKLNEL